jgi:hypothetical protein
VTALNRDLPPRDEQFISDYEQLRMQFPVSIRITLPVLFGMGRVYKTIIIESTFFSLGPGTVASGHRISSDLLCAAVQ